MQGNDGAREAKSGGGPSVAAYAAKIKSMARFTVPKEPHVSTFAGRTSETWREESL